MLQLPSIGTVSSMVRFNSLKKTDPFTLTSYVCLVTPSLTLTLTRVAEFPILPLNVCGSALFREPALTIE